MMWIKGIVGVCLLVLGGSVMAAAPLHHHLQVTLQPAEQRLDVVDTVTFPRRGRFEFYLSAGLQLQVEGASLVSLAEEKSRGLRRYAVTLASVGDVVFRYSGSLPQGSISPEGVVLEGGTLWYPFFPEHYLTFDLSVTMPPGWRAVSQGRRLSRQYSGTATQVVWQAPDPQEEIYLIAARFSEYEEMIGPVTAMAFLRQPDAALARRYLDVTAHYLDLYNQLIGPYPYAKFALVENRAETGYGMPSFTLLGPRVIRMPFILHSSYPHEILHNWWGNGVYVDYTQGNWAEGLTSYLADHLIQQQRGNGANFRRNILQNYADFVGHERDFPISEFRSRHSSSSEAVGYGKTQMVFHMLRRQIGDELFTKGLQRLYRQYLFKEAGFDDLARIFSEVSGENLTPFFHQWIKRRGAPKLQIGAIRRELMGDKWLLEVTLEQTQAGAPYALQVPLAVTLDGQDEAYEVVLELTTKSEEFTLVLPATPLRLDVDPAFDLFRAVDRSEIPPALSQAFGAKSSLLVLPSGAGAPLLTAYRQLAQAWGRNQAGTIEVVLDNELDALPADRAVWVLGWQNRFASQVAGKFQRYGVTATPTAIDIGGSAFNAKDHAVVLSGRPGPGSDHAVVWLAADNPAAIAGLARKLPHYRKYSYLAFRGDAPTNLLKRQWPVPESILSGVFERGAPAATLLPRPALAR